MSSAKGRVVRWLGAWLLRHAEVVEVRELGVAFRRIVARGEPGSVVGFQPGDKLELLLPSDDVRTFTPIAWGEDGTFALVVFRHDPASPVGRWLDALRAGDRLSFASPRRSLRLPDGPLVLLGDETSIGVAAAYARVRAVHAVFEVADPAATAEVTAAVGILAAVVVPRGRDDLLAHAVLDPRAPIAITGGGDLVSRLRARLRAGGGTVSHVKSYWVRGKTGLD